MNKLSILFIVIFAFVQPCFVWGDESPRLENASRDEKWKADLTWSRDTLPKKHVNLFHDLSEKEYYKRMNSVIEKIPKLDDEDLLIELTLIFAAISGDCDSHTGIGVPGNYLPINFFYFEEGLFVTGISDQHSEYYSKKLVSIEGLLIKDILKKIRPYVAAENEFGLKIQFAKVLSNSSILKAAGVAKSNDKIKYQFENGELELSYNEQRNNWKGEPAFLYLENRDKKYWFKRLENNIMYINYNSCAEMDDYPFEKFVTDVFREIDRDKIRKIIVDIRTNTGGDSAIIHPLFDAIQKRPEINNRNTLVVIMGRNTYSSGTWAAGRFKHLTNATLIGEPSSNSPNSYGNVSYLKMSNIEVGVLCSIKYWKMTNDPIEAKILKPHIFIPLRAKEYFEGRDVFLEKVGVYQNSPQNRQDSKQNKKPEKLKANVKKPEKLDNPFLERKLTDNPF